MKIKDFISMSVTNHKTPTACSTVVKDRNGNLYSYGMHYPLLFQIVCHYEVYWVLNSEGYSPTTGRHIAWARPHADIEVKLPSKQSGYSVLDDRLVEEALFNELKQVSSQLIKMSPRAKVSKQKLAYRKSCIIDSLIEMGVENYALLLPPFIDLHL